MKNGKRLDAQLHMMSDGDIYRYLWDNPGLIKEHASYTRNELEASKNIIREVISNVEKEDFIQFVRICYEAFKVSGESNRFFREVIAYIQAEYKILLQLSQEEPLPKQIPTKTYFFPSLLDYNDPFLYDFSSDFFFNQFGETDLRTKYKLNHDSYKKTLAKLHVLGLFPIPL